MATAVTSRKQDSVFGKSVATRVLRKSSLFSLSNILTVRNRRRCFFGMDITTSPSGIAVSAHFAKSGASLR
jgi:hypothetical protein